MKLEKQTSELKELSLAIKVNFFKIGEILKNIRDTEAYKERFNSFRDYIEGELEFGKSQAYRMISVFEEYGGVPRVGHISFRTLVQLVYVSDKEVREQLTDEAVSVYEKQEGIQEFYNKVRRTSQRTHENVSETDDPESKCLRLQRDLLNDIAPFKAVLQQTYTEMATRMRLILEMSEKYDNEEIKLNTIELKKLWKEIPGLDLL